MGREQPKDYIFSNLKSKISKERLSRRAGER